MDKKVYINSIGGISPSMAQKGYENVGEPDYKEFIQDAGLRRRMSRIIRMGVSSALMCLKKAQETGAGIESLDGIITGTGWGCLSDTEKFLISILENNERMLNPTSFIQSTSNTIGAQVALLIEEKSYNNTFVHGGTSFEASLLDAFLKLQEENSTNILVGGFDEMTPTKNHLLERMGVWRSSSPGEGAHFFLLSSTFKKSSIAEVIYVKTFPKEFVVKSIEELNHFLSFYGLNYDNIDKVICGEGNMSSILKDYNVPVVNFKELCGEYPTASAFALWLACGIFDSDREVNRILIVNKHLMDQLSFIILGRAGL